MELTKFQKLKNLFSEALGYFLVTREGTVVQTNLNSEALNAPKVGNQIVNIVKDFRRLMDESLYKREHFLKSFFETETLLVFFIRIDIDTFLVFYFNKSTIEHPANFIKTNMEKIDEIIGNLNLEINK